MTYQVYIGMDEEEEEISCVAFLFLLAASGSDVTKGF